MSDGRALVLVAAPAVTLSGRRTLRTVGQVDAALLCRGAERLALLLGRRLTRLGLLHAGLLQALPLLVGQLPAGRRQLDAALLRRSAERLTLLVGRGLTRLGLLHTGFLETGLLLVGQREVVMSPPQGDAALLRGLAERGALLLGRGLPIGGLLDPRRLEAGLLLVGQLPVRPGAAFTALRAVALGPRPGKGTGRAPRARTPPSRR